MFYTFHHFFALMISLIVHGGAWDIPDDEVPAYRTGCLAAVTKGWGMLSQGATAVDVVETVIRTLEDDETFDAGRGSHLNAVGEVELDASIMDGKTFRCGAVAGVHKVKNPIALARIIMDKSEHVLLVGDGAERFAMEYMMDLCDPKALIAPRELERWRALKHRDGFSTRDAFRGWERPADTVGAVAMDASGNISAGTSTGGTLNKTPGRVGDSPLIGCGTYADNAVGGVSATGWGEAIIKVVLAKTVIDDMDRRGGDPQGAAERGVGRLLAKAGGYGGVIVMDREGTTGVAYNTPRMARAWMAAGMEAPAVAI